MKTKIYAGIGARDTPPEYLELMTHIAQDLGPNWMLRSGGATGADSAFAAGAEHKEVHLPWNSYNNQWEGRDGAIVPTINPRAYEIAAKHHPYWYGLRDSAKTLMCRNVTIVLGQNLDDYAKMIICWTKDGRLVGGTSQAMRVAFDYDIPVFNLALEEDIKRLIKFERTMAHDENKRGKRAA